MNLFGPRIGLTTSPGMVLRLRKSKKYALVVPLVQRAKSEGENPVYYVLGQTDAGRYLFAVVVRFPNSKGYPVTARPMTDKEERRYRRWKER